MGHTAYCSDFLSGRPRPAPISFLMGPLSKVVDLTAASAVDLHAELAAGWERLEIHAHDIHSTADTAVYATEALLRWRRAPGELCAATMVIPMAEQIGIVAEATRWATELSLTTWTGTTRRAGGGRLALNLHRCELEDPTFADYTLIMLTELGIDPSELVLEIPDALGPNGCRAALDAVGPLLDRGSRVALDDHRGSASRTRPTPAWFPTGSVVKLDPALTSACDDPLGYELLQMAADKLLAEGYEVAAESIERQAQLDAVMRCNVGWAQGHLFSRPAPLV